jgi:hypothetical protein
LPNSIDEQLRMNEALWEVWTTRGVRDGTTLKVDFHFYAARAGAGERLAGALRDAGYQVSTQEVRTLLVFKGLDVEASVSCEWTLELLQKLTRELVAAADRFDVQFEGLGAEMPDPPPAPGA